MEEDIQIARIIAACFVAIVLTVGGCTAHETYLDTTAVVSMVKDGADPLAAKCAVSADSSICTAVVAKQE
jgi:hypothetical protein